MKMQRPIKQTKMSRARQSDKKKKQEKDAENKKKKGKIDFSNLRNPPMILRQCLVRSAKNSQHTTAEHEQRDNSGKQACACSKTTAKCPHVGE